MHTNEFDTMAGRADYDGYGYLAQRRYGLDESDPEFQSVPELVAAADAFVLAHAAAIGWTAEQLFAWANSKLGRFFGEAALEGRLSDQYLILPEDFVMPVDPFEVGEEAKASLRANRERLIELLSGQFGVPAVKGWEHYGAGLPSWISPDLQTAGFIFRKGQKWRLLDQDGELIEEQPSIQGINRIVNRDFGWWNVSCLQRYFRPLTYTNPPVQQSIYLSPGQQAYIQTGAIEAINQILAEGWTTWYCAYGDGYRKAAA